jgi:low temperature requirement protein LtrA
MTRFQRSASGEGRTTTLELFYDLVFVFAVTQVSHLLLAGLSWQGVGRSLLALLVVWWAWNYTTWVTNELDPESMVVRAVLVGLMLATLLMAIAIPQAFGAYALLFAVSYVVIQVGRHLFLTFVAAQSHSIERDRAGRILMWFLAAGVLWLAGAIVGGGARTALWVGALLIDYLGPLVLYWVPYKPRLPSDTWDVGASHFAERFQLFILITLGESIVITGATTANLKLDATRLVAFALAFLATAALWWLYFNYVAVIAQRRLELSQERTRLARDGYTYLHLLMVAGIIVTAVGDEVVISHPIDMPTGQQAAAIVAGPAIYLLAQALFRLRMAHSLSWKRLGGAVACVAVGLIATLTPALVVMGLVVSVLMAVIGAEQIASLRRRARGEPAPLERLERSTQRLGL